MLPHSLLRRNLFKIFSGYQRQTCKLLHHVSSERVENSFFFMEQQGIYIDSNFYSHIFHECADMNLIMRGKSVHAHSVINGIQLSVYMNNHIVNMYAKCGCIEDARKVFDKMPLRNVYSWNTMISGYVKCGSIEYARELFEKMPQRDVVAWNTIIAGYTGEEALNFFIEMQFQGIELDHFTCSSVVSACTELMDFRQGEQVHAYLIQAGFGSHLTVNNALVTMYVRYGNIEDARQVFDRMSKRDVFSWNAMIVGYAQYRQGSRALEIFEQMIGAGIESNRFALASVLNAYANFEDLDKGRQFHAHIIITGFERDELVGSALLDMYAKCRRIGDANQVFDRLPERNAVVWNAMIAGYSQHDCGEEALKFFTEMRRESMRPDECSFVCSLSACGGLAASERGKQLHGLIMKTEFASYVTVSNALVTMYAKCGSLEAAHNLFNKMPKRDSVSCNAMIAGYAQHGFGKEALHVFEEMLVAGIKPTYVTFIAVLSACSHSGLVDEGRHYFESMNRDHSINPTKEHYYGMIDLLARAGLLEEAEIFIENMPFKSDAIGWTALLGACKSYGNVELGSRAADHLLKLESDNANVYVSISNMYATAGRWDDVARVRKLMKEKGVKKKAGCSWIEINKKVHAFVAGDRSHPQTKEIYATLEILYIKMKEAGYVPDTSFSLIRDVDEEKENSPSHHSEKLVLAFG